MDHARYQEMLRKLRVANADADRVDGLRNEHDEVLESVASALDKLCDIVGALLHDAGPGRQQVTGVVPPPQLLKPGELDGRD